MASKSKNIAELLNGDVTIDATDIADDAVTSAKLAVIGNGGSGDAMLRFDYEGTNTDRARIGVTSSGQQLEFYTAGDNERMRIDSTGRVGIGTDAPASRLHIGKAADTVEIGMQFTNADGTGYVGMEGSSGNRFLGSSTNNMFMGTTGADGLEFATNNNVRMKVDSSGYVTKPNHPSFWAQTYNTYTYTTTGTIEFNSTNVGIAERYDNGGHYNATTGRFTAPVAGTYFFMLTCAASFSSNYLYLYILKNGSDIISRNYAQNSQYIENTLQVVTTLAVGDYVSCKTEKNATGGALYGPSFCGFLIG
jgi:hypothetical protein